MSEPYLMLGFKCKTTSAAHRAEFDKMTIQLQNLLADAEMTQLAIPGVYVVDLSANPSVDARTKWRKVSKLLDSVDRKVDGELEWFVHLADRRGCELSYN